MDEIKKALSERYHTPLTICADRSIPVSKAVRQVTDMIRKDCSAAADYASCRAKRKEAVAKRLQKERKQHDLKQQEVAEKTGINVVTLSGYEIGKNEPNMEALVRLADVYNVTLDYLMCRSDNPFTESAPNDSSPDK